MIDFHSHILPNIDDGSRSVEETINLIKEAKEAGFTGISLTSHYIENYYETGKEERKLLINVIKEQLQEKGIDIDLYIANEVYITDNIIELLKDGKISTINEGSYLLFEMPLNVNQEPMNLDNVIYSMQENKIIPVLAHPERYSFIQKEPNIVLDLIDQGVLMQANYGSILGQYGQRAKLVVEKLLENDMIHFLGSDVHRANSIYKQIPEVLEKIEEIIGAEALKELTTINPNLAIANKQLEIYEPGEIELTRKEKFKMFFKK